MTDLLTHRIDMVNRLARQRIINFYARQGVRHDAPVVAYAIAVTYNVLYGTELSGTPTAEVRQLVSDVLDRAFVEVYCRVSSAEIPKVIRVRHRMLVPASK